MTYSEEELKQIEDLASAFVRISDIAIVLDIPAEVLREDIADRSSQAYRYYRRGKILSKITLQRQEMEFARTGSPLAVENTTRALAQMEDDE